MVNFYTNQYNNGGSYTRSNIINEKSFMTSNTLDMSYMPLNILKWESYIPLNTVTGGIICD